MNKNLRKALTERCKDMGLTQLAIDRLVELGGEGLSEEATAEDIAAKADELVPFAKAMQSEVTRKTSSAKDQSTAKQSAAKGEGKGEGKGEDASQQDVMPEWAKKFQDELTALKDENAKLKTEKAQSERLSKIAAKAKELGIPEYLMKRVSFADDADIDAEMLAYKQELVNNSLMPKGQAHEVGASTEQMKADAMAWAKSLPDK